MKAYDNARKPKTPGKADDHRVYSDGLRVLAKIIVRSYGKESLAHETDAAIDSDNSPDDEQPAENQRDFLQE